MENVAVMMLFICLAILGIIANLLLLYIIGSNKQLRSKSTHSLLGNLAVADLIFDVAVLIIGGFNMYSVGISQGNQPLCLFSGFIITMMGVQSLIALLLIAIDRYRMLVLVKNVGFKGKEEKLAIALQILYSFLIAAAPLLGFGSFVPEPAQVYCLGDWTSSVPVNMAYTIWCTLTLWGIVFAIGILYWRILRSVRETAINVKITLSVPKQALKHEVKQKQTDSFASGSGSSKRKKQHKRTKTHTPEVLLHETRVTKRMFTMVLIVFLNWVSYGLDFLYQFVSGRQSPPWFDTLGVFMVILGTLVNPFMNIVLNRKYRQLMWKNTTSSGDRVSPFTSPSPPSRSPVGSPRVSRSVRTPEEAHGGGGEGKATEHKKAPVAHVYDASTLIERDYAVPAVALTIYVPGSTSTTDYEEYFRVTGPTSDSSTTLLPTMPPPRIQNEHFLTIPSPEKAPEHVRFPIRGPDG